MPSRWPSGPSLIQSGQQAFPASLFPQPESGWGVRTSATSGPSSEISSSSAGRPLSSGNRSPAVTDENGLVVKKVCGECKTLKSLSDFYKDKDSLGGYRRMCKVCIRRQEKARKDLIPTAKKQADYRAWRKHRRAKALLTLAKFRAKQKGMEFSLREEDISDALAAGVCELTGIPFNFEDGRTWDSPSLDRIDSSKGYTPSNVRVVLYCLNVMANTWGENKIIEIADAIVAQRQSKSASLQSALEASLMRRLDTQISPEYVLTWKHWDMQSGPQICALRARGRPISDKDYSGELQGWPTPVSNDDNKSREAHLAMKARMGGNRTAITSLQVMVQGLAGWPTPNALPESRGGLQTNPEKALERRAQGHMLNLDDVATLAGWPTPNTMDGGQTSRGGDRKDELLMGGLVQGLVGWATPTVRDHKDGSSEGTAPINALLGRMVWGLGQTSTSSSAPTGKSGASPPLNPAFSRWLMGFPPEWDASAPTAARSSRRSRQSS